MSSKGTLREMITQRPRLPLTRGGGGSFGETELQIQNTKYETQKNLKYEIQKKTSEWQCQIRDA
jgi:hypothetical protein